MSETLRAARAYNDSEQTCDRETAVKTQRSAAPGRSTQSSEVAEVEWVPTQPATNIGGVLAVQPDADNAEGDVEMAGEVDDEGGASSGSDEEGEAGTWLRDEEPSEEERSEEEDDGGDAVNVEGAFIM